MVMVQTTLDGARVEVDRLTEALRILEEESGKAYTAVYGALGLVRRFTGKSDVSQAIGDIQRLIAQAHMLTLAFQMLHKASGPVGWLIGGISVVGVGLTVSDSMQMRRARY